MRSLVNDYSETGHPAVLAAINATATGPAVQFSGYGTDSAHCARAATLIRQHIGKSDAEVDVHFLAGGTQVNLIVMAAALRPHEAVIATHYGHVNVHETGAIEMTGHKVIAVHADDAKITPALIEGALRAHSTEHMVKPRLVYVSNTTEIGSQYTKAELQAISAKCREKNLLLFLDGARLGSALTSSINDLTMADIANLTDMFYIGGTKNGALFGEALVVRAPAVKGDMRYLIKQRGGLLAKGWLLGAQFAALFTDKLFYEIGHHANSAAMILREGVRECGYEFLVESFTNQQFVLFPPAIVAGLSESFQMCDEGVSADGRRITRLCTSFATREDDCHSFVALLKSLTAASAKH